MKRRKRSPQNENLGQPDRRLGLCGIVDGRERGERGHTSNFSRSEKSPATHETRAQEGHNSNKDRRCHNKNIMAKSSHLLPKTQPGLEGKGYGTGEAAGGLREQHMH